MNCLAEPSDRGVRFVDLVVGWDAIADELRCEDARTAKERAEALGVPIGRIKNKAPFTTRQAIQAAVDQALLD